MTPRNYTLYQPPPPAGTWVIGKTLHIHVLRRPRLLTRWLCRLLLEWEWQDATRGAAEAGRQTIASADADGVAR
jgi:hypothetical protein